MPVISFFAKLNNFCARYPQMEGLKESAERMQFYYADPRMLYPEHNTNAAKIHFEEDVPKDLIQAIDELFKKKGDRLLNGTALTDLMLLRAIGWIGHHIESHVTILQVLIEIGGPDADK